MKSKLCIALLLGLLISGAATAGDLFTKHKGDRRQGEAGSDTALIYVMRPATMGAAIKTWSFVDDELIGVTRAKGYSFANVEPGKRTVWAKAENVSAIEVDLQAGETYYFKTALRMGVGKARVKLEQMNEAEATKYMKKCSFCEPTDEGRARATEIATNRGDVAEEKADKRKNKGKDKNEK